MFFTPQNPHTTVRMQSMISVTFLIMVRFRFSSFAVRKSTGIKRAETIASHKKTFTFFTSSFDVTTVQTALRTAVSVSPVISVT
jgi:hypothetical protein